MIDTINQYIKEMRKKYPEFNIIEENDKESGIFHTAKVSLYKKNYRNFDAEFLVCFMPAAFAGTNIYVGDKFQYSISTDSGDWNKRIKYLERIVEEVDENGIDTVKKKFNGSRIGKSKEKF